MQYGLYVSYDHHPTDTDVAALQATGASLTWRPRYIDYLRARGTFTQVQALAASAGIRRVECVEVLYAFNDIATRTLRARDAAGGTGSGTGLFPSVWRNVGVTGRGVVVGILDTGVNDAPDNAYPGHESLLGKFVGGGDFSNEDASLNTPVDSSANPRNAADPLGDYHGTHVAGTAVGSGGPGGILAPGAEPGRYAGMAPGARLVDCKVLTDAGEGGGSAAALEWCMAHANTVWGTDADGTVYRGVQVVNMSLGGATASDGTDANAVAVNAAVRAGIVVCVATGNDGKTAYMPSPASADLDISCGAFQDANSLQHDDDVVADYSNEGPRTDDGDSDHLDEMKPTVLGSGSDIVSALGDPTTDGTRYHNINGTSMATPTIAGLCALILSAHPGLTPDQVRTILQNTSDHRKDHGQQPPSAADPFHIDPNYHPSWGWGQPDAYAAVLEALDPTTTQVIAMSGTPALLGNQLQVQVRWTTQREVDVTHFDVYRAPDLGGYAGTLVAVSPPVTPTGHAEIARTGNRTPYSWTDTDPSLVAGSPYWYEVRWGDGQGRQHRTPAFRVGTDTPPVRARVAWVISHDAIDNDIFARIGSGTDPNHAAFLRPCGGSTAADSVKVVTPAGFGGGINRYFFHADLTDADAVGNFLPPSSANPWFLAVLEKGYVNTEGLVDSFSVTTYAGAVGTTARAQNPTTPTAEGQTTTFWIPLDPATSLNHAPVLQPIGSRSIGEGLALSIQAQASDPDGNALTYSTGPLPSGASFDAGARRLSWVPAFGQAGTYHVVFRVEDTQLAADSENVAITVTPRAPGSNTSPQLDPLADRTVSAEHVLRFTLTSHDREADVVTYGADSLPPRSGVDPQTGAFTWSPIGGDEGRYSARFWAHDPSGAADSETVVLTATPASARPLPAGCNPDTSHFAGTVGVDVQGMNNVFVTHPFGVGPGVAELRGILDWTGGPAIDLDLYLVDSAGNSVASGATATDDPEVATYATPAPGNYQWKVVAYDNPNPSQAYTIASVQCHSTATLGVDVPGRTGLSLAQNAPNPFFRSSTIRFALPQAGPVSLVVFDVSGRRLRTLADGPMEPGVHQRVWDGRTDGGTRVHAGVYFYRLVTNRGALSRQMILLP
jgi:subtilisin family serine protease